MSEQEFLPKEMPIAEFDEFRSQLSELQDGNSKAVFDYRDKKGNKEARSHVAKLRTTKAAIEKKRVELKESVLVRGRAIDSDAKSITAVVQGMIEIHEAPLKEIEQEEASRIETHKRVIDGIKAVANTDGLTSSLISESILALECMNIGAHFEEFEVDAHRVRNETLIILRDAFTKTETKEAEQAELERLRAESAERGRMDNERRIAEEAAANAKASREREEFERKEREHRFEIERAEREKVELENRALRQAQEAEAARVLAAENAEKSRLQAIEDERRRQQQEAERIQQEEDQRSKNKAHAKRINNEALDDLVAVGMTEECAKMAIAAIAKNTIRNISINY